MTATVLILSLLLLVAGLLIIYLAVCKEEADIELAFYKKQCTWYKDAWRRELLYVDNQLSHVSVMQDFPKIRPRQLRRILNSHYKHQYRKTRPLGLSADRDKALFALDRAASSRMRIGNMANMPFTRFNLFREDFIEGFCRHLLKARAYRESLPKLP